MRFFFKVRTNKTKLEEVPEIPLRRSPSIPDRKSTNNNPTNALTSSRTDDVTNIESDNSEKSTNDNAPPKQPLSAPVTRETELQAGPAIPIVAKETNTDEVKSKSPVNESPIPSEENPLQTNSKSTHSPSEPPKSKSTPITMTEVQIKSIPSPVPGEDKKPNGKKHSKTADASNTVSSEPCSSKSVGKKSPTSDSKSSKHAKQSAKSEHKASKHSATPQQKHKSSKHNKEHGEEKRENIKIKIDLSRQNSMTIIKSSLDDLKMKFKKERDSSDVVVKDERKPVKQIVSSAPSSAVAGPSVSVKPDKSDASVKCKSEKSTLNKIKSNKSNDSAELKKPIIVRSDKKFEIRTIIKPDTKDCLPVSSTDKAQKSMNASMSEIEDVKKSEFLNSFNLTPTKSLSPEKLRQIEEQKERALKKVSPISRSLSIEAETVAHDRKTQVVDEVKIKPELLSPVAEQKSDSVPSPKLVSPKKEHGSTPPNEPTNNKRKNKESPKNNPKKLKISPVPSPSGERQSTSPTDSKPVNTPQNDRLSETKMPKVYDACQSEVKPSAQTIDGKETIKIPLLAKSNPNASQSVRPKNDAKDQKPLHQPLDVKKVTQSFEPKPNTKPVTHNIHRPMQSDTPRPASIKPKLQTMPTKKLTPILPKPSLPMVNIPSSVSTMLRIPETEIKQIKNDGTNKDFKVYGPTMEKSSLPLGARSPSYIPSYNNTKPSASSSGYLNYALLNSQKRLSDAAAIGMRSPAYTPNSPIYSPNSPQYTPNYNIPKQPQFKYMKPPAYLTNLYKSLTGNAPTTPTAPSSTITSSISAKTPSMAPEPIRPIVNESKPKSQTESLKRAANNSKIDEFMPPEKQTKVQSLLDSCNISFPSSLSITLHEENDPDITNPIFKHKNNSPVNNYIEIVKLPDTSVFDDDSSLTKPTTKSPPLMPDRKSDTTKDLNVIDNKQLLASKDKSVASKIAEIESKLNLPLSSAGSSDKKVPDLNPIDKNNSVPFSQTKSAAVNFQEKFLQSILEKKTIDAKLFPPKPITSKSRGRPCKIAPVLVPAVGTANSQQFPTPNINGGDVQAPAARKPTIKPKDLTKLLPHPPEEPKPKQDSVLDLSSGSGSNSAKQIFAKQKTSSAQGYRKKASPSPPGGTSTSNSTSKPSTSGGKSSNNQLAMPSPLDQQQAEFAKLFTDAMARCPSAFMVPPVNGLQTMQNIDQQLSRNIQQAYWERYSGDLLRMQKAGHFQLREAYEKYEQSLKNAQNNKKEK